MTSSKTLRRRQRDVEEFDNALGRMLEVLEPRQRGFSSDRTRASRDGSEYEAGRRADEVDRVSGRAAYALASVGSIVEWKPPGRPSATPSP
jgi:hypothetical protein